MIGISRFFHFPLKLIEGKHYREFGFPGQFSIWSSNRAKAWQFSM